jgi:hypothetical protein
LLAHSLRVQVFSIRSCAACTVGRTGTGSGPHGITKEGEVNLDSLADSDVLKLVTVSSEARLTVRLGVNATKDDKSPTQLFLHID